MSWQLVSQRDGLETRETSAGVLQKRVVREVVREKAVTAYENTTEAGTEAGLLSFKWTNSSHTKSLTGANQYLCIADEIGRMEIPGNGGKRVQVWVNYGAWENV